MKYGTAFLIGIILGFLSISITEYKNQGKKLDKIIVMLEEVK